MSAYALLVLSPHLDDAVLSCGGEIAETTAAGGKVLIVTVFTADEPTEGLSAFATQLHHYFTLPAGSVASSRRAEDEAACAVLGAERLCLGLDEAIYRREAADGRHLYDSFKSLFGPLNPSDDDLTTEVVAHLGQLPDADRVLAPLAVGNHVDHQLVRRAAERAPLPDLAFYEDYPYVERWLALRRVLKPRRAWRDRLAEVGAPAAERKISAIDCYASQVTPLFRSRERMRRRVARYLNRVGGERRWRKVS